MPHMTTSLSVDLGWPLDNDFRFSGNKGGCHTNMIGRTLRNSVH